MKSKYLRLRVPEGEGSEVIEYESKEPFFGCRWVKGSGTLPYPIGEAHVHTIGTKTYIIGGRSDYYGSAPKGSYITYDHISKTISTGTLPSLSIKFYTVSFVLDSDIYIGGGYDSGYTYDSRVHKFDTTTNRWYDATGLPAETSAYRNNFENGRELGAVWNNVAYLFPNPRDNSYFSKMIIYGTSSVTIHDTPFKDRVIMYTIHNGIIYVYTVNYMYTYDISTSTWEQKYKNTVPGSSTPLKNFVRHGNKIYTMIEDKSKPELGNIYTYDLTSPDTDPVYLCRVDVGDLNFVYGETIYWHRLSLGKYVLWIGKLANSDPSDNMSGISLDTTTGEVSQVPKAFIGNGGAFFADSTDTVYMFGGIGSFAYDHMYSLEYKTRDLSFVKKKLYRHIHKKPELAVVPIDSTYIPQPGDIGEGFVSEYYPMYYDPDGENPLFDNDMMYGFCISDKVYAFGITPGSTLPRKVVMNLTDKTYDITDYTTENANTVPTVTATRCVSFVINGKGYLCNGQMHFDPESDGGIGDPLFAATIQYDPVLDSWTRMADMLLPISLSSPVAAVANGLAYVMGHVMRNPIEKALFDPVANSWEGVTDIDISSLVIGGTAIFYDGLIYVLSDFYHSYGINVFRFDPVTRVASMTSARKIGDSYYTSTSFVLNEKLCVTAGDIAPRMEVYDSQTNVWSVSGDPGIPHVYDLNKYDAYNISGVYNNTAYIFHAEGCTILKPADFIKKINTTEIIEDDGTDTSDCILSARIVMS